MVETGKGYNPNQVPRPPIGPREVPRIRLEREAREAAERAMKEREAQRMADSRVTIRRAAEVVQEQGQDEDRIREQVRQVDGLIQRLKGEVQALKDPNNPYKPLHAELMADQKMAIIRTHELRKAEMAKGLRKTTSL